MTTADGSNENREEKVFKGAFGRLLKFWRESKSLSQQELALRTGGSMRHISFLENDRARPRRELVLTLANVFELQDRDKNALLLAAGYHPATSGKVHHSHLPPATQSALILSLKCQDPYAASAHDRYGNIVMVNRAWVATNRHAFGDRIYENNLNIYRLFLENDGWRDRLLGWQDLACSFLFTLKCSVLTYPNDEAEALLEELVQKPGIPPDWAQRAANMNRPVNGLLHRQLKDGTVRSILSVNMAFGMTNFYEEPRLILSYLYPQDGDRDLSMAALDAMDLEHPLLLY